MIPRLHKWTIHLDTTQLLTPGENKKYPKISRVVLKRKLPFSFFWFAQLTLGNSYWQKTNSDFCSYLLTSILLLLCQPKLPNFLLSFSITLLPTISLSPLHPRKSTTFYFSRQPKNQPNTISLFPSFATSEKPTLSTCFMWPFIAKLGMLHGERSCRVLRRVKLDY